MIVIDTKLKNLYCVIPKDLYMSLNSVEYFEYPKCPQEWQLHKTLLKNANLIVGKNATGKSRFLRCINGLARLLAGEQHGLFGTGHYKVEIEINNKIFKYVLDVENGIVENESLHIDGKSKFTRAIDGTGEIYAEELKDDLKFRVANNVLVAFSKVDSLQHPYLIELGEWAKNLRFFEFGSSLGQQQLLIHQDVGASVQFPPFMQNGNVFANVFNLVHTVQAGLKEFPTEFKKNLLKDLSDVGFACTDIGVEPFPGTQSLPPVLSVYVCEKGLDFRNHQTNLSQGFYRALALLSGVNLISMRKMARTILVDDIGEGLDYERSSAVIKKLLNKSEKSNVQIVMTSNDRFVMNAVSLKYWTVLDRSKGKVKSFNSENSKQAFEDFEFLGMNNFDFFATKAYKKT
jgi:AAA15 family ATPase/GTPase